MSLSAANEARLQKALNQIYRFDKQEVCTLKEYLDKNAVAFEIGHVRKYTWEHINRKQQQYRLSPAEVQEMEDAMKTTYRAYTDDRAFLDIPKMVYEYYVNGLGKPLKDNENSNL